VLGIGFYLKRFRQNWRGFLLAGREMTAWVAGLAFVSANLGSLELLGWAGSAYQYGILAAHWIGLAAIRRWCFWASYDAFSITFQRRIPFQVICNCVMFGDERT